MSAIVLTKKGALSVLRNRSASSASAEQARELRRFSRAALMDDLFFAGIVVAIFCLVLAVFSRTLIGEWAKAPVAAVAIAGKPIQQQIERPQVKVSVERNLRLPRFSDKAGFSDKASFQTKRQTYPL